MGARQPADIGGNPCHVLHFILPYKYSVNFWIFYIIYFLFYVLQIFSFLYQIIIIIIIFNSPCYFILPFIYFRVYFFFTIVFKQILEKK